MDVNIVNSIELYFNMHLLKDMIIFTSGMVAFGFFIWFFYRFLAKRDILGFDIHKYNTFQVGSTRKFFTAFFHVIEFLFLVPIFTFFWFSVLAIFLIVLSKSSGNIENVSDILLLAMSIVATTRIVSYFNEDLSKDIAKMLPFGILATFVIDPTILSIELIKDRLFLLPKLTINILHYALFTILFEFVLRAYYSLKKLLKGEENFLVEEHLKKAKESGNFEWND